MVSNPKKCKLRLKVGVSRRRRHAVLDFRVALPLVGGNQKKYVVNIELLFFSWDKVRRTWQMDRQIFLRKYFLDVLKYLHYYTFKRKQNWVKQFSTHSTTNPYLSFACATSKNLTSFFRRVSISERSLHEKRKNIPLSQSQSTKVSHCFTE